MEDHNNKYKAFISYRHADNKIEGRQWATWLHHAIETYEVPEDLIGQKNGRGEEIPARIYPVFRDEEDLPADADLDTAIIRALDSTHVLVVLCSPNAVESTYVADEIEYFKKIGGSNRIVAGIIDGEPNASWDRRKQKQGVGEEEECYPLPLQFEYDEEGRLTDKRTKPNAADFRVGNEGITEQGWTSPEGYRQHLQNTTDLDKRQINSKVEAYRKQSHLMLLKIVAGILGVPVGDLSKRDKEYQLQREKAKSRALIRWFTAIGLLLLLVFIASLVALQMKKQAALSEQKKRILETAKNAESARYFLINNQHGHAIELLYNSIPMLDDTKIQQYGLILSYLLQPYRTKEQLPVGLLEEQRLYSYLGGIVFYRDGQKHRVMSGTPTMAHVDTCEHRIIIGFDDTPSPSLHVFDSHDFKQLFVYSWENIPLVFSGPPIAVSDENYLLPTYTAGSYAGANVESLYYLKMPNILSEIRRGNGTMPFYAESDERLHFLGDEGGEQFELLNNHPTSYVRVENYDGGFDLVFRNNPECQDFKHWQSTYDEEVDDEQPAINAFPLPYRLAEEKIWRLYSSDTIYPNILGTVADNYVMDYRHGTLHPFPTYVRVNEYSVFFDNSFAEKSLSVYSGSAVSVFMVNHGTAGADFLVCSHKIRSEMEQLTHQFVDPYDYLKDKDANGKDNCNELSIMDRYENYLKYNPYSRYLPFKHGFFTRDQIVNLLDLHTGNVLPIEPPEINALDFDFIAFSNSKPEFVGLFGNNLLTYRLNSNGDRFELQTQRKFLYKQSSEKILSMQLGSLNQVIILFATGRLISINPENGLINWQIQLTNQGDDSCLVASEDQRFVGVIDAFTFKLFDADSGMQLSGHFVFDKTLVTNGESIDENQSVNEGGSFDYVLINKHGEIDIGFYTLSEKKHIVRDEESGEPMRDEDTGDIWETVAVNVHLQRYHRPAPQLLQLENTEKQLIEMNLWTKNPF